MSDTPASPPSFHIGLTAAGAVSAGAYTAGVLDLLFEALDAMEAAQDSGDPAVPTHRVKLSAMVGASAGAMNAAIVAAWAQRAFPPVTAATIAEPAARARNPFAWAWVDQPDIARLLDTADLAEGRLASVMNGAWLDRVVGQILSPAGGPGGLEPAPAKQRAWIAGLRVRMTVGNLTGTPYLLKYEGDGPVAGGMMDHSESMDFVVAPAIAKQQGHYLPLTGPASAGDDGWAALGQAALASGAFPAALPFRLLDRPTDLRRPCTVLVPSDDPATRGQAVWTELPVSWDWLDRTGFATADRARFLCVDGGIANNEPTDLCREALDFKPEVELAVSASNVSRAMIMVDPFPDVPDPGPRRGDTKLLGVLAALISAWKNQARFRPVDLWLAARSDVFSRQMIAPSRDGRSGDQPKLAGAPLGGFFGFFHRDYRMHDYQLGRHNCRSFLRRHFAVPVDNVVVKHWAMAEDGGPTPLARAVMREHGLAEDGGKVPLVWLAPHLRVPAEGGKDAAPEPAWPTRGGFDPQQLRPALQKRIGKVAAMLGKEIGGVLGTAARLLSWPAGYIGARAAVAKLQKARDDGLL
jgi:predicted acylesterase/phospholipase RssA